MITVEHKGVEISYVEDRNVWTSCEGGEAASLASAKHRIDEFLRKQHEFPKFEALLVEYSGIHVVTVTSVERDSAGHLTGMAWVSRPEKKGKYGGRSKERLESLRVLDVGAREVLARLAAIREEDKALRARQSALEQSLVPLTIT